MYSDLGENSILLRLSQILRDWEQGGFSQEDLVRRIYAEIKIGRASCRERVFRAV